MSKYYDDALQAAFMAREFGVKYNFINKKSGYTFCISQTQKGLTGEHVMFDEYLRMIGATQEHCPFYIHEDSLPIFEPQLGDWGRGKAGQMCFYVDDELKWYEPQDGVYIETADIITRRPKLHFFTPESE